MGIWNRFARVAAFELSTCKVTYHRFLFLPIYLLDIPPFYQSHGQGSRTNCKGIQELSKGSYTGKLLCSLFASEVPPFQESTSHTRFFNKTPATHLGRVIRRKPKIQTRGLHWNVKETDRQAFKSENVIV